MKMLYIPDPVVNNEISKDHSLLQFAIYVVCCVIIIFFISSGLYNQCKYAISFNIVIIKSYNIGFQYCIISL